MNMMRVTLLNEGNTFPADMNKSVTLGTHYKMSSHFSKYKMDPIVSNTKTYFLTATFHPAVVTKTREKDRLKELLEIPG